MILFILTAIAFIVATVDMSRTWLDKETQNVLYYDSDSAATDKVAAQPDETTDDVVNREVTATESDTIHADLQNLGTADTMTQQFSEISDDIDDLLQETFDNEAYQNHIGGFGSELDEVQLNGKLGSDVKLEQDVEELFSAFKDMIK